MNDPSEVINKLNQVGYEFLISDVEVALTLTRIACRAHQDDSKRLRNIQNARRAYEKVRQLVTRVGLTPEQQQHVDEKLSALKSALQNFGQQL